MAKWILMIVVSGALTSGCANKQKEPDREMVRKYPKCYHQNMKIFNECVKRNEAGETVTALEIENDGLPK
ncbi:MAG: hypothetical protein IT288_14965 [Bdellovibrionales bacterium]|nr:hypothetical protein [Bdellovibrionales bacterium]